MYKQGSNHIMFLQRRQSISRRNDHEARFLLKLATHFIHQGYAAEEITILSTYADQTLHMCSVRIDTNFQIIHTILQVIKPLLFYVLCLISVHGCVSDERKHS